MFIKREREIYLIFFILFRFRREYDSLQSDDSIEDETQYMRCEDGDVSIKVRDSGKDTSDATTSEKSISDSRELSRGTFTETEPSLRDFSSEEYDDCCCLSSGEEGNGDIKREDRHDCEETSHKED